MNIDLSSKVDKYFPTPTEEMVTKVEQSIGFVFPFDYKQIILSTGGFGFAANFGYIEFISIISNKLENSILEEIIPFINDGCDLYSFLNTYNDYVGRIPRRFVPIASDSLGNRILMNKSGECRFWDHDHEGYIGGNIRRCTFLSDSFEEFLRKLSWGPEI